MEWAPAHLLPFRTEDPSDSERNVAFGRRVDRAVIFLRREGVAATLREIARRMGSRVFAGGRPPAVYVEVSSCCNLHCEYCVLDTATAGAKVMSLSTFSGVLPSLAGSRRIDLSGLAEPLMNRHFLDMLSEARSASPHAHIGTSTNATPDAGGIGAADRRRARRAGVQPRWCESRPGRRSPKGRFLGHRHRQHPGASRLRAHLGSSTPAVSATFVLQRANLHQLPGVVQRAAELGREGISVNGPEPYSVGLLDAAIWLDPSATLELEQALTDAESVARSLGVDLRLLAMSPQPGLCPQISRPIVLADGNVVPCSVLAYGRPSFVTADSRPCGAAPSIAPSDAQSPWSTSPQVAVPAS